MASSSPGEGEHAGTLATTDTPHYGGVSVHKTCQTPVGVTRDGDCSRLPNFLAVPMLRVALELVARLCLPER